MIGVPATTEKLVAASAVTFRVALAGVPGAAWFDVTVLVAAMNTPLALEAACTETGTSQDAPAESTTEVKPKPVDEKVPLPRHETAPTVPSVMPVGKVRLKAMPDNDVPLGLVMVRSYVEVFEPPAKTVDGVKLALIVGGT